MCLDLKHSAANRSVYPFSKNQLIFLSMLRNRRFLGGLLALLCPLLSNALGAQQSPANDVSVLISATDKYG